MKLVLFVIPINSALDLCSIVERMGFMLNDSNRVETLAKDTNVVNLCYIICFRLR